MRFTVSYEAIDGTAGLVVQDVSLYMALWQVTGPFERVLDDASGIVGFQETAHRRLPTNRGEPTQRRTLRVPPDVTASSMRRLARYLKC